MVPFLDDEIIKIVKRLVSRFLKRGAMELFTSSLDDFDFDEKIHHLRNDKIHVGFAPKLSLSYTDLTVAVEAQLRSSCQKCLSSIVFKLLDNSPVTYDYVVILRATN